MAHSTARDTANLILEGVGLDPILSDDAYVDRTQLDKYQRITVIALDMSQRNLGIELNKRFLIRPFTFSTIAPVAGVPHSDPYTLAGTSIEGFKANSFFNVTTAGANNWPLRVATYEQWRVANPNPDLYGAAPPAWIIPVPDDGSDTTQIIVWPYADAVYTIEGQCRIVVAPIQAGTDQIIFPKKYEHVLIAEVQAALEGKMNEGRDASAGAIAARVTAILLRDASGAYEEKEPIDLGFDLWDGYAFGNRYEHNYNPATDVCPPYSP